MKGASRLHHLNSWECRVPRCASRVTPTGLEGLDELLPDGGWPKAGVVEVAAAVDGFHAMELFLPALTRLTRQGRRLVLVEPTYPARNRVFTTAGIDPVRVMQVNPHPGRSVLWTVESLLQSAEGGVVMAWPGCSTELMDLRLRKAALLGKALCILFRPLHCGYQPSAVGVRLALDVDEAGRALYLLNPEGTRQAAMAWDRAPG